MDAVDPVGALRDATRKMLDWQHVNLRQVVGSLSTEALNWVPAPEANSIAAIVFHTLAAESELVAAAAGVIVENDGTAFFQFAATSAEELVTLIDRTEQEVNGYLEQLREEHLGRNVTRRGYTDGDGVTRRYARQYLLDPIGGDMWCPGIRALLSRSGTSMLRRTANRRRRGIRNAQT